MAQTTIRVNGQHFCPHCYKSMFRVVVTFDDYEISMYETTGECVHCEQTVIMPTSLDRTEAGGDS